MNYGVWAEEWSNCVVRFWCEKQAVVYIVNNLMSHSERVMTLQALKFNILVQAQHVPRIDSSLADALSHQQIERFRELDPGANEFLEILSPEVWQIGVKLRKGQ